MKATGTNTATTASVTASTASAISLVPFRAASHGVSPCSRWRTMFSMTTMASSMRRPMERVSASMVMMLKVKPERLHDREGADDGGGERHGGDERRADVAQEEEHDHHGEDAAEDHVLLHGGDGRADELRAVHHHRDAAALGELRLDPAEAALTRSATCDGVGAGLLQDDEADGALAAEPRRSCAPRPGRPPPRATCAEPHRHAARARHDEGAQRLHRAGLAGELHRALHAGLEGAAARHVDGLRPQRRDHVGGREAVALREVGARPPR